MAIVTFWNSLRKESGQTTSAVAIATNFAIEHNYRVLLIDANFHDDTMEKAYFKRKDNKALMKLNQGKLDISSGAEGLISAVASNKVTPELITNYTKVVFKNRLDVLLGLVTPSHSNFEQSMALYKDLIRNAAKYYDIVIVDLEKTLDYPYIKAILEISDLIMYSFPPNLNNIDNYIKKRDEEKPFFSGINVMPIYTRSDETSAYNLKNTTRYIREKVALATVPYNVRFMEATNQAEAATFFANLKLSQTKYNLNQHFIEEVKKACVAIIERIKLIHNQKQLVVKK